MHLFCICLGVGATMYKKLDKNSWLGHVIGVINALRQNISANPSHQQGEGARGKPQIFARAQPVSAQLRLARLLHLALVSYSFESNARHRQPSVEDLVRPSLSWCLGLAAGPHSDLVSYSFVRHHQPSVEWPRPAKRVCRCGLKENCSTLLIPSTWFVYICLRHFSPWSESAWITLVWDILLPPCANSFTSATYVLHNKSAGCCTGFATHYINSNPLRWLTHFFLNKHP